jgi:NADPH:quinone reductase-like Zn-dependent oxidoreductase
MTITSSTVRIEKNGGPEEMKLLELPVGEPGPGEIRIRHHACGLNFIDVYQRSGVYPLPLTMADELFALVESGKIVIRTERRYALADVAQAHRDLEARETTGSSILIP